MRRTYSPLQGYFFSANKISTIETREHIEAGENIEVVTNPKCKCSDDLNNLISLK